MRQAYSAVKQDVGYQYMKKCISINIWYYTLLVLLIPIMLIAHWLTPGDTFKQTSKQTCTQARSHPRKHAHMHARTHIKHSKTALLPDIHQARHGMYSMYNTSMYVQYVQYVQYVYNTSMYSMYDMYGM